MFNSEFPELVGGKKNGMAEIIGLDGIARLAFTFALLVMNDRLGFLLRDLSQQPLHL